MSSTHVRSTELGTEGRTLVGLAFRWDHPSMVQDPGSRPYLEEFTRTSVTKTLQEHPTVPLLKHHQADRDPVGVAMFRSSAEGLVFEAPVAATREGDELLELVEIGAMTGASVRFAGYKERRRSSVQGPVTVRTEIGLRELSIVTTGFGAHEGAQVLAVRSELATPRLEVVRQRLAMLAPLVVDV